MTPQKIADVASFYAKMLRELGVAPRRIDPECSFSDQNKSAVLAHAAYLCENIAHFVQDEGKLGKANRHLASAQMCLSFAGLYTLNELRFHNAE